MSLEALIVRLRNNISLQTTVLQHHLRSHDAELLPSLEQLPPARNHTEEPYFLLVPHQMLKSDVPIIPSTLKQPLVATEMWVERCLLRKTLVKLEDHITNTPFEQYPIPGNDERNGESHVTNDA